MTFSFALDPLLERGSVPVAELPLSLVRLMDDQRFPWLVLVPQVGGAIELIALSEADRATLIEEVAAASSALREVTRCTKLNVAALGNVVPQLHIHVIGRNKTDAAWPDPVFGKGPAIPYAATARDAFVKTLRASLAL